MSTTSEVYSEAADRAVTKSERLGLWSVYGYYRIEEELDGDLIAVADRTVPKNFKPATAEKDPISVGYSFTRLDGSEGTRTVPLRRVNPANHYMPLEDYPDLFDKFARLAETQAEIRREEWLRWLHEYGVLGVLPDRTAPYQRNEITDSFSDFVEEASLANRTLRLFEAIAVPNGPNVKTIRELLPEGYDKHVGDEPDQLQRAALRAIQDTIEKKVHADCYQRLVPRDTGVWRKKNLSPFARRWEFISLVGAMWLQFEWLVTMDSLRYCEAPGCNNHISSYERSDKKTCDATCRKRLERSKQND
ncbi:hypothetical protein BH24ACT22_BH24ACT22_12040 [soil metagenome]